MPQKKASEKGSESASMVDDLISALTDRKVIEVVGTIFEEKVESLLDIIRGLQTTVDKLERELNAAKGKIDLLENNNTDSIELKEKIDALEGYNRLDNLIIAGMPVVNYAEAALDGNATNSENSATTEHAVLQLANSVLHVPLQPNDISVAHRLGKKRVNGQLSAEPARIIVKFTNRKARNLVYGARKNLKQHADDTGHQIFVNEDLTAPTADLFRRARDLVKRKIFHGCWTSGGVVYVKKSSDRNSKPIKVSLSTDLLNL